MKDFPGKHRYPLALDRLPAGWAAAWVGDVCAEVQSGFASGDHNAGGEGVVHLRPMNVSREGVLDLSTVRSVAPGADARRVQHGDVLFNNTNSPVLVGKTAAVTLERELAFSNHMTRLCPVRGIDPRYLARQLHFLWMSGYFLVRCTRHVNQASLSPRELETTVPVAIAPLPEQRRIVEALESYFTRLDDAVATLGRVERNLARYRPSVLGAATAGRLVPTEAALARREGHRYEPASVLLERILAERRRCWAGSGKKGRYPEPASVDAADLPALPEGWCWTTVDSLIWDAGYGTSQRCTHDAAGPAVLRIPNVQDQALRLDDLKYATEPERLDPDGAVAPGDLLFIRTNGSRHLIGRGAVVLDELPAPHHFASYLIRLRVLPVGALPRWVGLVWHAPLVRAQILDEAASSSGQYNVGLKAATRLVVPLAPAAEQARILDAVERADSLAAAARAAASASIERAARLRQAILKWAFEGKLVDRDPGDEPASAFLAQIRAQRASVRSAQAPVRPGQAPRRATRKQGRP